MSLSNPDHSRSNSILKLLWRLPKDRFLRELERKQTWLAISLLFVGLLITLIISLMVKGEVESVAKSEFGFACEEIENKITTRLHAHAQLLRSLSILFEANDGVTREDWRNAYLHQMINKNLPGIQGVGYSIIIPKNQLAAHQKKIRNEGFPNYSVNPKGNREIYTAIIYLEPFTGRNLRAFGYDMFSEPIRRMAMEKARDFNVASLTRKIILVQETEADIQAGTLMYLPIYKKEMPAETVEERRTAIQGWVYSPYRMHDLMKGILGGYGTISEKSIDIEIYDDASYNKTELLYDSKRALEKKTTSAPLLSLKKSISFNDHQWYLRFTQYSSPTANFDYSKVWYTAIGGTSVSLLIFVLYLSLISSIRANELTEELAGYLSNSEKKFRDLIENSHDIIYTITPDGIFTFVSPSWTVLLGHPVNQVVGQSFQKFVHPVDLPLCQVWLKKVNESGERQEGVEYRVKHNDGTWYWHTSSAVPLADEAGTSIGFEGIARDITERKRVEETLRRSEEDYRKLFEDHAAVKIIIDPATGNIHDANLAAVEYYGWSREELRKMKIQQINVLPLEKIQDEMKKVTEHKKVHFEFNHRRKDGSIRDVDVFSTSIKMGGKEYLHSIIFDITERRKAEEALHLSEERLQLTLDVTQIGTWDWNLKNDTYHASPIYYTMLGYEPEYGLADRKVWIERGHPDDMDVVIKNIHDVLSGKSKKYEYEARVKHADGKYRWLRVIGHAVEWDDANKPTRLIGVRVEITERKNAEEMMKKLHEEQQILLDNIPAWVFFKDTENRFIRVNKTFANAMGMPVEQLEKKSLSELFPIEQAEGYWKDDKEVFASGQPKINIIEQMKSPTGNIWVQTDKIPYRNLQGEIVGIIGFAIDITERKAAEDKIQKVNDELKELNLTKDKFFSIIAHDLKSPFQGFLGLTQIMAEEANSFSADDLTTLGTEMHQTADNLFALLKNLLEWAQMQNGSMSFEPKKILLSELISESIRTIRKRSEQKEINIINETTDSEFVFVDNNMINSVLLNLLSNAVKFTKRTGTIIVKVKRAENKMLEISVRDTGIGIPKDKIQKLFKAGEKIGTKGTEGELSTGLGLLLCKEFVEKHGGKIRVESQENIGSTFYFTVPESEINNS